MGTFFAVVIGVAAALGVWILGDMLTDTLRLYSVYTELYAFGFATAIATWIGFKIN